MIQTSKRIYIDGRRSSPNGQIPSQHTNLPCKQDIRQVNQSTNLLTNFSQPSNIPIMQNNPPTSLTTNQLTKQFTPANQLIPSLQTTIPPDEPQSTHHPIKRTRKPSLLQPVPGLLFQKHQTPRLGRFSSQCQSPQQTALDILPLLASRCLFVCLFVCPYVCMM